ncbi:hypothetical protein V7794_22755 [Rhizobium laguerreae]
MKKIHLLIFKLFLFLPGTVFARDPGFISWCIDSQDNPSKMREVNVHVNSNRECEVWVITTHEQTESQAAFVARADNETCYNEFARVALEQKEDGFHCGGSTYVGDLDWDLKPAMDLLLSEINDFLRNANEKVGERVIVLDITPDFNDYEDWEWSGDSPPEDYDLACGDGCIEDPQQRIKEETPRAYIVFGKARPQDTDQYETFLGAIDGVKTYLNAVDPTASDPHAGWLPLYLGQRSVHTCFGGEENYVAHLTRGGTIEIYSKAAWGELTDNCPAEYNVARRKTGGFNFEYQAGSFVEK